MVKTLKNIFKQIALFWSKPYFKGEKLYRIAAILGLIARGIIFPIFVPSAFDKLSDIVLSQWNLPYALYVVLAMAISIILDRFITPIIRCISYLSAGNFYRQYSSPAAGSVFYTIFYIIYTVAPLVILYFFNWICVTCCAVIYFWVAQILYCVSFEFEILPDNFTLRIAVYITLYILITAPMITLAALYPNPF